MLNHAKVIKELTQITDKLFIDISPEYALAYETWKQVAQDPVFIYKVRHAQSSLLVPSWQGLVGETTQVGTAPELYRLLAIDGSQIYPDKHHGISCFLVNIGIVELAYGQEGKRVVLDSVPQLFMGDEEEGVGVSPDIVNCKRQELEFSVGLERSLAFKNAETPFLFLFDGSLIFWHLDSKDQCIKNIFLPRYIDLLERMYQERIPMAGYISAPKSKELINLVRLKLHNFVIQEHSPLLLEHVVDGALVRSFLKPFHRTIVFKNQSKVSESYSDHVKPHFFYLHVGNEVGRVEIPAWIAEDPAQVNLIAALILDQAHKGRGYPIGIAEAHEQAVVKGPDRDFFYHLIQKVGMDQKLHIAMSQKLIKKRGLGI